MSYTLKELQDKFEFDLEDAFYEIDALQNEILQFYLRADQRFRQAFHTNFTPQFIQFLKDKAKLNEPIHLSVMGQVRSGKSYASISICAIHSLLNGKKFTVDYLCANKFDFVENLKLMEEKDLHNSIFLIDEDKRSVYGVGSIARKMKLTDVQNIIAYNNISTISLTPDQWSNEQAFYGLRAFGRCFKTKTVRFMLYNLQGGGTQGETPLGMVYMPIFTQLLPKKDAEELEKEYLTAKKQWVNAEMRSESDVLGEIKRKRAEELIKDSQYLSLTKKDEKITYISQILGSESTTGEIKEIYNIAELLKKNISFDKPKDN